MLAKPEPVKLPASITRVPGRVSDERPWPSYQITLSRTRAKSYGRGPDRSLADFSWSLIALTRGRNIEETIARLLEVSERVQSVLPL